MNAFIVFIMNNLFIDTRIRIVYDASQTDFFIVFITSLISRDYKEIFNFNIIVNEPSAGLLLLFA